MAGIPEDSEADDATRIFGRFLASMREGNIGNAWAPPARCPTGGEETLGRPGSRAAGMAGFAAARGQGAGCSRSSSAA
jgi:hypothetical protein